MTASSDVDTRPDPPPFDAAAEAKLLLRTARTAALATLLPADGSPFATLVTVATAMDSSPLLLLSELSAHTRHLMADPRLSLLVAATGAGDPLSHPRLTLAGRATLLADPEPRAAARRRFLARHPHSALYADFGDFGFWQVAVERVHLNGGFARAANLQPADLRPDLAAAAALEAGEAGAIDHMNADHADALALYATRLAGQPPGDWRAAAIDPEGIDLCSETANARVLFPAPVADMGALRQALVALAKQARQLLDPAPGHGGA